MLSSRIFSRSVLLVGVLFCLLIPSSAVAAGAPASVTVRVEGLTETKLLPTLVTTTATPVVKDGNAEDSCSGTSALGALQLATAGNWAGPWEAKFNQYSIYTIAGETHEFEESSSANYFWSFWLNNKEASVGACEAELQAGDQVLFFPGCFGASCPPPLNPLGVQAPATAEVRTPVIFKVSSYHNPDGAISSAVGATVEGGGTQATTDAQGEAKLIFPTDGTYTVRISAPESVRTETAICVHEGNDGTCGTTKNSPGTVTPISTKVPSAIPTGPNAILAKSTGLKNGHVYSSRHAPRVLAGKVVAYTTVSSISIRLRRSWHGRCWAYSGKLERFMKARCGHDSFFNVPTTGSSFSYLLPSKLRPGRYVYEIEAIDSAGNHSAQHPGASKIVFYVK
jgi:hypothetical protein